MSGGNHHAGLFRIIIDYYYCNHTNPQSCPISCDDRWLIHHSNPQFSPIPMRFHLHDAFAPDGFARLDFTDFFRGLSTMGERWGGWLAGGGLVHDCGYPQTKHELSSEVRWKINELCRTFQQATFDHWRRTIDIINYFIMVPTFTPDLVHLFNWHFCQASQTWRRHPTGGWTR